jgi:carboxypeptidase Taq
VTTPALFTELVERIQRARTLGSVSDLLGWDEQVNLPPGAADQRAAQLAVMAEVQHAADSDPRIGAALAGLETNPAALTGDQAAVVRQARRDFDRATRLPADFVREKATQGSRG